MIVAKFCFFFFLFNKLKKKKKNATKIATQPQSVPTARRQEM
jgi:hypothetical protein